MADLALRLDRLRKTNEGLIAFAERAVANPGIAYTAILGLQLHILWNIWRFADLVYGDSSAYFVDAATWSHDLRDNFVWSPLYNVYWGTILAVVRSVYASEILQRSLIIVGTSLLVLMIARRLFGPALGMLLAVWWIMVPNDYSFLYEIHPFGFVPPLLALGAVVRWPRREGVGIALAILLAGAALDRNELIAAFGIVLVAAITYEVVELRRGASCRASTLLRSYLLPIGTSLACIAAIYERSYFRGRGAWLGLQAKNELNLCQSFAYAYQQQYPKRFLGNPFTDCPSLMQHVFGRGMPTTMQAIAANPGALANFLAWNAHKVPAGIQVALFGATSFSMNPSVLAVTQKSSDASVLSILLILTIVVGLGVGLRRGWLSLRKASSRTRWVVLLLAAVAFADLLAGLFSSPLPEYLYGLTICGLLLVGLALALLIRSVGATRFLCPLALLAVIGLIAFSPSAYKPTFTPTYAVIRRLVVAQTLLQRPGSILLTLNATYADSGYELCNYLAYDYVRHCSSVDWASIKSKLSNRVSVEAALNKEHVTAIYADSGMVSDPDYSRLLRASKALGWQEMSHGVDASSGPWSLLIRSDHDRERRGESP